MTDERSAGPKEPRWVRRDSERACFICGVIFLLLAIMLPLSALFGKHFDGFGLLVAAVLEASWVVLSVAYLRSAFYKRGLRKTKA